MNLKLQFEKRVQKELKNIGSMVIYIILKSLQKVGNNEYTGMNKHAEVLEKLMGRKIKYVEDLW